ncbi:MAG: hypothetical protein QOE55_8371 [Acidobacteriaceae bacterium]|jgi:hypothetical protein|nr:hypothetical protein [Acidobacteriaceae bacterium]
MRHITGIYRYQYGFVMQIAAILCLLTNLGLEAQQRPRDESSPALPKLPEVRVPFVLRAVSDPRSGKGAFSFDWREIPPVIRATPGGQIRVEYINQMSPKSAETCVDGPCMNMTNLHFHGLHVSPDAPGRRHLDDGDAGRDVALCRRHSRGLAAGIVLVPYPSAWRELPAIARWDVGGYCGRRY